MSTAANTVGAPVVEDRAVGLWADAFRRMRRNPAAIIGGALVGFFLLVAIFAPFIAPYDPTQGNLADSYLPPSSDHWFGTNVQGQDMFSRIVFGSRLTLGIATLSVVVGVSVGATFGSIAGYFRGRIDAVIMRGVDIMLSIPGLLFAIAVVTFLGQGVPQIAIAIAILNVPIFARLLRGTLLGVREAEYVTAARKIVPAEAMPSWEAGVRALYEEMAVITVTPDHVVLHDFETTLPKAVADLIAAKS